MSRLASESSAPGRQSPTPAWTGPAIDLVHLARQSLGDRALEMELLSLFERQAGQILTRLSAPAPRDTGWRFDLAHTLTGSARAVGAFNVASASEAYGRAVQNGDSAAALGQLAWAVATARAMAKDLLDS